MRKIHDLESTLQSYHAQLFGMEEERKLKAKKDSEELNLAQISLSAIEASLLSFFVKINRCEKFIEIGTLTGYSALWILEGLSPQGSLWTFEKDLKHSQLAKENLRHDPRANVIEGDAEEHLPKIASHGPFDGIFIDGNKAAYPKYLDWSIKNLRPGGIVIADNILLGGRVMGLDDPRFSEKQTIAMQAFNTKLTDKSLFNSILIPTTEGLILGIKN